MGGLTGLDWFAIWQNSKGLNSTIKVWQNFINPIFEIISWGMRIKSIKIATNNGFLELF